MTGSGRRDLPSPEHSVSFDSTGSSDAEAIGGGFGFDMPDRSPTRRGALPALSSSKIGALAGMKT